jgi:hypothetical protein
VVVVLARLAWCLSSTGHDASACVSETFVGAAVMLPALVVWGIPAQTLSIFMVRPILVATILAVLRHLDVTASGAGAVTASGTLLLLVLWLAPRELSLPDPGKTRGRASSRWRAARPPADMLRHDAWARPLRVWGWPVAVVVAVMVVALYLDLEGSLPFWGLFAAAELMLIAVLIPLLRPFDSKLFGMSLVGRGGARLGDELRAWSVLPVQPVSVLRCVWVHGLALAGGLWVVMMAVVVIRTWVRFGVFGLRAADGGNLGYLLLPTVALVPMLAGFLVATAAGDKLRAGLSGGLVLVLVHGNIVLYVVLRSLFGRDSVMPVVLDVAFLAVVMVVASVPPLGLLRSDRSGSDKG